LGIDFPVKIRLHIEQVSLGRDSVKTRLDPREPIARLDVGSFKRGDSGFHAAIITAAAVVVKRWTR
jgi:hypothetical protein